MYIIVATITDKIAFTPVVVIFHASTSSAAGFPVCVLRADPADAKKWSQENMSAAVEELIEQRILPKKSKKDRS